MFINISLSSQRRRRIQSPWLLSIVCFVILYFRCSRLYVCYSRAQSPDFSKPIENLLELSIVHYLRVSYFFRLVRIECNYSGFNFSHYDLPFPTRYCIPYVRSGLYQLVIRVKGFRVSAHDLDTHCMIRFCPSAWTPRFQKVELCIASARTTLAVSAVAPS